MALYPTRIPGPDFLLSQRNEVANVDKRLAIRQAAKRSDDLNGIPQGALLEKRTA